MTLGTPNRFRLYKFNEGEQGVTGSTGATGSTGSTGSTGAPGTGAGLHFLGETTHRGNVAATTYFSTGVTIQNLTTTSTVLLVFARHDTPNTTYRMLLARQIGEVTASTSGTTVDTTDFATRNSVVLIGLDTWPALGDFTTFWLGRTTAGELLIGGRRTINNVHQTTVTIPSYFVYR